MPIIIGNTNNQGNEIADSMARVADSIWGKGAQQAALLGAQTDVERQKAYALSDQNTRRTAYFNALRSGDATSREAVANAAASGDMAALAAAHLFQTATQQGATSQAAQNAQVAAGQSYGNTYGAAKLTSDTSIKTTGMQQAGENARNTERLRSEEGRTAAEIAGRAKVEEDKRNAELVDLPDPSSPTGYRKVPRIQAGNMPSSPGTDIVKGGYLAKQLGMGGQQPQQPILKGPTNDLRLPDPNASGSPFVRTPAPTARNLTNTVDRPAQPVLGANVGGGTESLSPDTRTMLGLPTGHMEFSNPSLDGPYGGMHGVSQDGGQTIVLDNGQRIPVAGSGFAAVGGPTAFQDVQAMEARRAMAKDLQGGEPTADSSQIMSDLANLPPGAVRDAAGLLNAGAGLTGLNAFLPGGEVGADTNRATQRLAIFNNQMKRAFKNSEAFGFKEQRDVNELLPGEGLFTNPVTESKKIPELYKFLIDQRAMLKQQIATAPLADQGKIRQAIMDNNRALQMITSPKWGGSIEAAAGPAPATGGAPTPQGGGGFTHYAEDGQGNRVGWNGSAWVPVPK